MEIWKAVKGYEGYEVSNKGNVRSFKYKLVRLMNKNIDRGGYYRVKLTSKGIGKYVSLHRLVASNFINEIPNHMVINHIDGNKSNNCIENLEIVTQSENLKHAFDNNLKKKESKSVVMIDKNTFETLRIFESIEGAAKFVGVSASGISRACQGAYSQSGGYGWKYKEDVENE